MQDASTTTIEYCDGHEDGDTFSSVRISAQEHVLSTEDVVDDDYRELDSWQQRQVRLYEQSAIEDHDVAKFEPYVVLYPSGAVAKAVRGSSGRVAPGGERGAIYGFSMASRRRMRERLIAVRWHEVDVSFCSLTWHLRWDAHWQGWKRAKRTVEMRLLRRFPNIRGFIWRFEFQQRGAPHFHVAVIWRKGRRTQEDHFERYFSEQWSDVLDESGNDHHRRYGVDVIDCTIRRETGVGALVGYITKEMSKSVQGRIVDEDTGECIPTGRCWGIVGDVPISEGEPIRLTEAEWNELCLRANDIGKSRPRGWYLRAIRPEWQGFLVIASESELLALRGELGMRRIERERWRDVAMVPSSDSVSTMRQASLAVA